MKMAEIVKFTGCTYLPAKPKDILQQAKKWGMDSCIVIGFDGEANLKFGGTTCELGEILEMLELAKKFAVDNIIARRL